MSCKRTGGGKSAVISRAGGRFRRPAANGPETLRNFAAVRRLPGLFRFSHPRSTSVFEVKQPLPETAPPERYHWLCRRSGSPGRGAARRRSLGAPGWRLSWDDRRLPVERFGVLYRFSEGTAWRPWSPWRRFLKGNLAEAAAAEIRATGPHITTVNACSSGSDAIGVALSWLRAACAISRLPAGDDSTGSPFCGFASLSVMSRQPCAP